MSKKTIWLAGGCYWGVQAYLDRMKGIVSTRVGFANGTVAAPSYEQVKHTETGHAETVEAVYDPDVLPLKALLRLFRQIVDPLAVDRQGHDVGHQYRAGVYWQDPEDEAVCLADRAEADKALGQPCTIEYRPLECFYTAEEYHQKYLDKNPGGYCHVAPDKLRWIAAVDPRDWAD